MVQKTLNQRKEMNETTFTDSVTNNYYPITSAIAVRDFNKSSGSNQKQVTVMTERSQGASAGMRLRKNIEVMHQRRYRRSNSSLDKTDGLNDMDGQGRGLQIKENYYMQISTVGKSKQRELQRQIDQPLLLHYSQGHNIPSKYDSSKSTNSFIDLAVMEKVAK